MRKNMCPVQPPAPSTRGCGASGGSHTFNFSVALIIATVMEAFWCCVLVSAPPILALPHTTMGSKNQSHHSETSSKLSCLRHSLGLLDANFFIDKQVEEIDKAAKEFNVPIIVADRKLVASENGGLHYPSPLIFNADWEYQPLHSESKKFECPSISKIQRPESEEDIAFMSVLELGALIKTKQITSQELTQIFLRRLRKYNPVLEAVITFTEELAHKQAKEADELLSQGVYLGTSHQLSFIYELIDFKY